MPRVAKLMLVGVAIDALGVGLVLPFLVIYLHEVLGIPVSTVGVLAALPAVVGLALVGPIGILVDRLGPRRVQMGALVCSSLGAVALAEAGGVGLAAVAMLLTGVGHAAFWPASQSLVAAVLPSEQRTRRLCGLRRPGAADGAVAAAEGKRRRRCGQRPRGRADPGDRPRAGVGRLAGQRLPLLWHAGPLRGSRTNGPAVGARTR